MKEAPLVSLLVPVYNAQEFMAATVESALAQTYENFELVVVDDGSTDGSLEQVEQFDDPRIRVVRQRENRGMERAFNRCLAQANGSLIKLLCADDLLHPTCLERQVAAMLAHDVGLVCCDRDVINAAGSRLWHRACALGEGHFVRDQVVRSILRTGRNILGEPTAVLFRAELAEKAGSFVGAPVYSIDLDYWCRLLEHGDLYSVGETLCSFRINRGSTTSRQAMAQFRDRLQLVRRLGRSVGLARREIRRAELLSCWQALQRQVFLKVLG